MSSIKTPIVTYVGINQEIELNDPEGTLLECSIASQIPHIHECGGNGLCTTCRVRVLEGSRNLSPKTMKEREISRMRKWDPSIRLACQCYVKGDVSIQRLVWTSSEINNLQLETVPEGMAEERAIAILFCDIRGFTKMASSNSSFDVAHILNRFYTVLGDPILINNGVIYQYVGDEIIGLFGVSGGTRSKNCNDAIRAALGMQYAIERLNKMELVDFDVEIQMGIGINFGKAFIGHLGHPKHKQFAVIGDPVNTASRIQAFNKVAKTKILISRSVFEAAPKESLKTGGEFSHQMAGHDHETQVLELLGFNQMDIQLELQSSLDHLLRNEDEFAAKFYDRVFTHDPGLRSLFKNDMTSQGRLLTHMLGGIVYSMSRPEHLERGLKMLGESHTRYGVLKEHYPVVLSCLLETIEEQLGALYSPELMEAWEKALTDITTIMRKYA